MRTYPYRVYQSYFDSLPCSCRALRRVGQRVYQTHDIRIDSFSRAQLYHYPTDIFLWRFQDFVQNTWNMYIRVVPEKKIIITRGKWKSFTHWFQICFYFFPDTYGWFLISDQSFPKPKGGPLDEKNLKKIDFYVWYIKRTALKNVDWKWNRFLKILIFVEVMDQKVPKNAQNPHICSKCLFFGTF